MIAKISRFFRGGPLTPHEVKAGALSRETDTLADTARKMVETRNQSLAYAKALELAIAKTRNDLREAEKTLVPPQVVT